LDLGQNKLEDNKVGQAQI